VCYGETCFSLSYFDTFLALIFPHVPNILHFRLPEIRDYCNRLLSADFSFRHRHLLFRMASLLLKIAPKSNRPTGDLTRVEAPVTFKAYLLCVFAAFGGILFGYDSGYINGVLAMDYFKQEFGSPVQADTKDAYNGYMYHTWQKVSWNTIPLAILRNLSNALSILSHSLPLFSRLAHSSAPSAPAHSRTGLVAALP
jgi:hypothetical protein